MSILICQTSNANYQGQLKLKGLVPVKSSITLDNRTLLINYNAVIKVINGSSEKKMFVSANETFDLSKATEQYNELRIEAL